MSGALCYPGGERVFQAQGIARVKPQRLTAPFSQLSLGSASIVFEDKQQLGPQLGVLVLWP